MIVYSLRRKSLLFVTNQGRVVVMKEFKFKPALIIKNIEKILLGIIAFLTVIAVMQEIYSIYINGKVQLADLLLLFIYTEVLGMIGIFYVSNKIPITLPLFIAMTAIARLIILQGKGMDPIILLYEAGAILIIALACLAIRFKPLNTYVYQSEDEDSSIKIKNQN